MNLHESIAEKFEDESPLAPCSSPRSAPRGDEGYMLLAVIVMVFLVLLTLSLAAPRVAMQLKRDQEMETQHRANQYVRAIRVYYRKFGHYPGSVDQLLNSNNQKFLRQKYLDPLTGKEDWKPIAVGANKTKVKGFFGEDLSGIGGGLGAASGLSSSTGSSSSGAFNSGAGTNTPGSNSASGTPPGQTGSAFGSGTGTGSGTGNKIGEQDATSFSGGGGPFMGVGVSKSGDAFLTVNGVSTYQEWEFLYDPRIEQLYAKANLMGGGGMMSGSPSSSGLGTGTAPTFGAPAGGSPPTPPIATPTPPTPQ